MRAGGAGAVARAAYSRSTVRLFIVQAKLIGVCINKSTVVHWTNVPHSMCICIPKVNAYQLIIMS